MCWLEICKKLLYVVISSSARTSHRRHQLQHLVSANVAAGHEMGCGALGSMFCILLTLVITRPGYCSSKRLRLNHTSPGLVCPSKFVRVNCWVLRQSWCFDSRNRQWTTTKECDKRCGWTKQTNTNQPSGQKQSEKCF